MKKKNEEKKYPIEYEDENSPVPTEWLLDNVESPKIIDKKFFICTIIFTFVGVLLLWASFSIFNFISTAVIFVFAFLIKLLYNIYKKHLFNESMKAKEFYFKYWKNFKYPNINESKIND